MRGQKHHRQWIGRTRQGRLQFQTIQPGHFQIRQHTTGHVGRKLTEKGGAGIKGPHGVAGRNEQARDGTQIGNVVIYNENGAGAGRVGR